MQTENRKRESRQVSESHCGCNGPGDRARLPFQAGMLDGEALPMDLNLTIQFQVSRK